MSGIDTGKSAKILIVEDEQPLRELLRMELLRKRHKVHTASGGEEGLTRYREENYNVVLLDIKMPGMDGIEVLRRMRAETNLPEIIMFTGHGTIESAIECIKLGAYDYLTKPVKLDELDLVIDKAHEKNRLRLENISLKLEVNKIENHQIVGRSLGLQKVLATVKRWGPTDEHVLIYGESGTGKELIARAVHDSSRRAGKCFVTVNCGRLNGNTAESELFGHMQGAFTSAVKNRGGLFELADTGTLFMDEVSDMPLDVQVTLLRVLETGSFRRLGGNRDISVDVRIIFATNKNLQQCVDRGEFREDLFHRINLLPIDVPPLRERPDDILPLAWHFIKTCDRGHDNWEVTEEAMVALCAHRWPGNVRELKNTVRRACLLATEPVISTDLLPFSAPMAPPPSDENGSSASTPFPLWVIEKAHIHKIIELTEGNKSRAAKILEIDRKTLYHKLDRYGMA